MASAWILGRTTPAGGRRWEVRYRLGGAESRIRYGGRFRVKREAEVRRAWIAGELAARRVPDMRSLEEAAALRRTVAQEAARWQRSRIDVAETTAKVHRVSLAHVLRAFGDRDPVTITPGDVSTSVGGLAETLSRGSIQKARSALAQVLDHAGVDPNPARHHSVHLPRDEREEVDPPSAAHVDAIVGAVSPRYRLPLVVLEVTGMRVGELERLRWGDVDEHEGRWRVSRASAKSRRARWVQVPPDVFRAVLGLLAREDRDPEARVFPWLRQARLRTEMSRACRAAGIPLYSPHDLRHRRISLWHRQGIDWARIGAWAGQRNLSVTADTYTHVLTDEEVDRGPLLR